MTNAASLINKNNQRNKCNCTNKTNSTLKGKCQFECKGYKEEEHSRKSNDNNVNRNVKKVYVGSTQGTFKKILLSWK